MTQGTFSERLRRFGVRWERRGKKDRRETLQSRLDELELRFGEYDHRVKNNTQMILGILTAAGHASSSPEVRSVLHSVTRKLEAIMHVQTLLRHAGNARTLRCDELIRELSRGIRDASPRQFVLMLECESLELPSAAAVPLGLILNELLTNAIKHGIGPDDGRVRVQLKAVGNTIELRVDDNGPGIGAGDLTSPSSGLSMVRHLSTQLHGRFQTRPGPGGHCILRFQAPPDGQH